MAAGFRTRVFGQVCVLRARSGTLFCLALLTGRRYLINTLHLHGEHDE
jgi:hypothetical protein